MNLNQNTLIEFEEVRSSEQFIMPLESNSFYTIGNGILNIYCIRNDATDYRFDTFIESGSIESGIGSFFVSGDIEDIEKPYKSMTVKVGTELIINDIFIVNNGNMDVHGTLRIKEGSSLIINNGGSLILYPDSKIIIDEGSNIIIENNTNVNIYGEIIIDLTMVDAFLNNSNIYIDSAAVKTVENIDLGEREYSLTDYEYDLRDNIINPYTQGEWNSESGRIGYTWKAGSPVDNTKVLELSVLWGTAVLGDFKLSILGVQNRLIRGVQIFQSVYVAKKSTMYIAEEYLNYKYLYPELYLGVVIDNCKQPAICKVDGTIIVSGNNSKITIDRGASLYINDGGSIYLKNNAKLLSTNNDANAVVLYIGGTLIIDDISQIVTLESGNVCFGENGKVIILNPGTEERRVLLSIPNGIEDSDLYRIFKSNIDHVEYHICENTGISIDQYYDYYSRDLTNWFGGRRIEKAIYEGLIVWHDYGFIELNHDIIPWASLNSSLYEASRLFKSYGTTDKEKLQEVVERLKYAGAGDITFRFVEGDAYRDITLVLNGVSISSVINNAGTNVYTSTSDNDGSLFMRNRISDTSPSNIVTSESKTFELNNGDTEFEL